jgi:hypothetical protein
VSSALGKLEVMRHFRSGIDWAKAGDAKAGTAAAAMPAFLMKPRRSI